MDLALAVRVASDCVTCVKRWQIGDGEFTNEEVVESRFSSLHKENSSIIH